MADMLTAKEHDIFVDGQGKLYRVIAVERVPVITLEEVEGHLYDPNAPLNIIPACIQTAFPTMSVCRQAPEIRKAQVKREITDEFWTAWKRIWRAD